MSTIRSLFFFSFAEPTILFLLLFSLTSCHGEKTSPCVPSSCGDIHNIKFPFRLKSDPKHCGNSKYELDCQNNRTILSLDFQRYHVQSINYDRYTIRVIDPGLVNDNPCSFPLNSTEDVISRNNIYFVNVEFNVHLTFINCLVPVNSYRYVDITFCTSSRNTSAHRYIVAGDDLTLSDLEESCSVEMATPVVRLLNTDDYTSVSRIHEAVINGIELSWNYSLCSRCRDGCRLESNSVKCNPDRYCYEDVPYEEKSFRCKLEYWSPVILFFGVFPFVGIFGLRLICGYSCLIALVVYKWRRRHLWLECENVEDLFKGQIHFKPIRYSYSEIKKMTNNFKEKLGTGVYGTVFKGKLRSGPPVAVKMMDKSVANAREFLSAVATIGRFEHVNVMQLIGFCSEGQKQALVYDFMPNGSLQNHIFPREGKSISLSYENLYEISLGVARGIDHLCRSSYDNQTLYFGIKPHNVLLGENMTPKISDFGLIKLCPRLNYIAPEFYYKSIREVSHKADVYSFGMLLMEIISCRRKDVHSLDENASSAGFPSWADDQLRSGKDIEIGDATEEERKTVKKMIKVALWCIQMKPADRPPISKVLEMLEEDDAELLEIPSKPLVIPQEIAEDQQISIASA